METCSTSSGKYHVFIFQLLNQKIYYLNENVQFWQVGVRRAVSSITEGIICYLFSGKQLGKAHQKLQEYSYSLTQ